MRSGILAATIVALTLASTAAQEARMPVIDMHMHATTADSQGPPPLGMCTPIADFPAWDPTQAYADVFLALFKKPSCLDPVWSPMTDQQLREETITAARRWNITGVLSGPPDRVDAWMRTAPGVFLPGYELNIGERGGPSLTELRARHADGRLRVLAEVGTQYAGIAPGDARLEPYWALAEELDIPVGIHIGPGPPGAIYLGAREYRAALHSALTLEPMLVKHPRLRVYVMHAGFPMLDDMLAVLYAHPQVYVDTGVIVYTQPRAAFYRYLQGLVEAGFGKRVMFGSDQMVWPGVIGRSIAIIEDAPFLTTAQKRDILHGNASRFLRLDSNELAQQRAHAR
jgi:uncharacterized protein